MSSDASAHNLHSASAPPWYKELTGYHWFVLLVASLGWLFDTMDQQIFNLARRPAIAELLASKATGKVLAGLVAEYAGYATSIFIIGWAIGVLDDKVDQRVREVFGRHASAQRTIDQRVG